MDYLIILLTCVLRGQREILVSYYLTYLVITCLISVPKEDLLPCEWCGKGIPAEYLQTHQVSTCDVFMRRTDLTLPLHKQLQQCPQLPDNDKAFLPSRVTDVPPAVVTDVADHKDITPAREGM